MSKLKFFTDWKDVPLLLDIAALSILIGKSYESTRLLVAAGEIPAVKFGTEWRIKKSEIMKYLGEEES